MSGIGDGRAGKSDGAGRYGCSHGTVRCGREMYGKRRGRVRVRTDGERGMGSK